MAWERAATRALSPRKAITRMTKKLILQAQFLSPRFHGLLRDGSPEWPPSPFRMFQALLNGAMQSGMDSDATRAAFRWLETQDAPVIFAPKAKQGARRTSFVPSNDGDSRKYSERLTSKNLRPSVFTEGLSVSYIWELPDADETARNAEILIRAARRISALGWGLDAVIGNGRLVDASAAGGFDGERWSPIDGGASRLRVPAKGALDNLTNCHAEFMKRALKGEAPRSRIEARRFRFVEYAREGDAVGRRYEAFDIEGYSLHRDFFALRNAFWVGDSIRRLMCRDINRRDYNEQFGGGAEAYLAGHIAKQTATVDRVSCIPLPSYGHPHVDGQLCRALIAEPIGGSGKGKVAEWARRRLSGEPLYDKRKKHRGLLVAPSGDVSRRMVERYTRGSKEWSSVTPVVLPGTDKRKRRKAEAQIIKMLTQAGYPESMIWDWNIRKTPHWRNGLHAERYHIPPEFLGRGVWHLELKFKNEVRGPVTIGAGRFRGLGVMVASD